jgi:pilus assembly protein CpaB
MNKRILSVLVFALVISAVASVVLYRLIASRMATNARAATTQIVVATHNLEVGSLLKDLDLKTVDWTGPEPKGALTNRDDIMGRGVIATIYEGEPILETRLAAKGAGAGLAATIPPGMRAATIRVNDVVGVGGFVRPGARVDVLIAGNPPGAKGNLGTVTKTLLQNMEVLSAGQDIQKDAEGKPVSVPTVNLLVTPEQAETLSLASNETRIQLVLRNPLDTKTVKTPGTAVANLFTGQNGLGLDAPKPPAPKRVVERVVVVQPNPIAVPVVVAPAVEPKKVIPFTVEVITGSKRALQDVPRGVEPVTEPQRVTGTE